MNTAVIIGTAVISTGFGFLICAVLFTGKYAEVRAQRDRLLAGLRDAAVYLKSANHRIGANQAYALIDEIEGGEA